VRNEHWKNHLAKPHDVAAHADREDDHAPGTMTTSRKMALANAAIRRRHLHSAGIGKPMPVITPPEDVG
jgi:hypothetical protein